MSDFRDHNNALLAFYFMNCIMYQRPRNFVAFQLINDDGDETYDHEIDHRIFPRNKKFKYDNARARV